MKIMITGCNGQLGRAVGQVYEGAVAKGEAELLNTDAKELDITKEDAVLAYVQMHQPDVIINCAAYTNVNQCESEETLAYTINADGPENLAKAAKAIGCKFLHVSTDYVFDGNGTRPYVETDPTNEPCGAYGRTKLAGEQKVQAVGGKYYIVRTAWLYGDGNNFVKTMVRLGKERGEVRVVADQFGTPTSAMELARAIRAILSTECYGIYHGTCEGSTNWADFTEEIFAQLGLSAKVCHITTEEYPTPAKRPAYSVLEDAALKRNTDYVMADWKDALKEYLGSEAFLAYYKSL